MLFQIILLKWIVNQVFIIIRRDEKLEKLGLVMA